MWFTVTKLRCISNEGRRVLEEWKNQFAVNERDGKPFCLLCRKILGVCKTYNVKRHFDTTHATFDKKYPLGSQERAFQITSLEKNAIAEQNTMRASLKVSQAVTLATFKISWLLAKHGKPFSNGELVKNCFLETQCLFDDLSNKNEIIRRIKSLQLSNDTVTRRISEISENLTEQLKTKLTTASALSLAADESTDIVDVAQLCIWVRCGEDIHRALSEACKDMNIPASSVVSITTDGAPSMTGKHKGLIAEMRKISPDLLAFHYLILHSEVRWLSHGKVLNRFLAVLPEIVHFLNDIGEGERFPVLRDNEWKTNVAFLADVTAHLNKLNLQLQGDGKHVDDLLGCIESFKMKLGLYTAQLKDSDLTHFPLLNDACDGVLDMQQRERFVKTVSQMQEKFISRFSDFEKIKYAGHFIREPFTFPVEKIKDLAATFGLLLSSKVLSIFGSTYICERTFSAMTRIKSRFRARLTDYNLQSQLHCAVTPSEPNFTKLVGSRQHQVSH
uniref:HAT C-terminal dimerisation domain-containing protein n=1 Tax=Paramormyrops kingsleyae TaxID=1676925 RepID=A0A3B3RGE1_9TELE